MKTYKNLYPQIYDLATLYTAYRQCVEIALERYWASD